MKKIIFYALAVILYTSCATPITMGEQYAKMYEERPLTIAIMPPINQTTHAEAKDYFYTTLYSPLCEKGYYVYSPYLTMELFQQESAYDAELFYEGDISIFQKILGADAVIFTVIKDWRRNSIGGRLSVDVQYVIRSTKTGQTLYEREGQIAVDTSVNGGNGGVGALVGLLATAANTAITDKVVAGRKCNAYVLSDLPAGKYSTLFDMDQNNPAGKAVVQATVK